MAKAIANAVAARERVPFDLPVIRINGFNVPMARADLEQAIADAKARGSRITRCARPSCATCCRPCATGMRRTA